MLSSFQSGPSGAQGEDPDRKSAFHRLQSEFLILDQERQKKSRYHDSIALELRRLEMEQDRLAVRINDKKEEEANLTRELTMLEAETKRLKRKMSLLS